MQEVIGQKLVQVACCKLQPPGSTPLWQVIPLPKKRFPKATPMKPLLQKNSGLLSQMQAGQHFLRHTLTPPLPPPLLLNCQVAALCRLGSAATSQFKRRGGGRGGGRPPPSNLSAKLPPTPQKRQASKPAIVSFMPLDRTYFKPDLSLKASLAQLVEHALRKRMVVGSIPTGGSLCD